MICLDSPLCPHRLEKPCDFPVIVFCLGPGHSWSSSSCLCSLSSSLCLICWSQLWASTPDHAPELFYLLVFSFDNCLVAASPYKKPYSETRVAVSFRQAHDCRHHHSPRNPASPHKALSIIKHSRGSQFFHELPLLSTIALAVVGDGPLPVSWSFG